jgi:hypothetical protein
MISNDLTYERNHRIHKKNQCNTVDFGLIEDEALFYVTLSLTGGLPRGTEIMLITTFHEIPV